MLHDIVGLRNSKPQSQTDVYIHIRVCACVPTQAIVDSSKSSGPHLVHSKQLIAHLIDVKSFLICG